MPPVSESTSGMPPFGHTTKFKNKQKKLASMAEKITHSRNQVILP
jgi:hypothetical protein